MNVPRLFELYFLSCILDGVQTNPKAFLAWQLYSAAISTKGRRVISGIINTIARFLGVEPNAEDRVSRSEWLDHATFELMGFYKVEARRLCRIYPGNQLLPLLDVERTTLLHQGNL